MIWDLYQSYQIQQLDGKIARVQNDAASHSPRQVAQLEERLDRLALICCSMFELLREAAPGVTDERLAAKITEIDLRDGTKDGRMTPKGKRCPKCEAMMSPKFGRCLFCGHQDADAGVRFG